MQRWILFNDECLGAVTVPVQRGLSAVISQRHNGRL
jgi:hypothetical protein